MINEDYFQCCSFRACQMFRLLTTFHLYLKNVLSTPVTLFIFKFYFFNFLLECFVRHSKEKTEAIIFLVEDRLPLTGKDSNEQFQHF